MVTVAKQDDDEFQYHLNNQILEYTEEETDLGGIVDSKLKLERHISTKVYTANKVVGIIRRSCTYVEQTIYSLVYSKHL